MDTVVNFKAFCNTDPKILRRIIFPKVGDISYSNLQSKLSQLFNIKDFKIRYIDEEEDLIAIDNDLDLHEAIKHVGGLTNNERLVIKLSLEKLPSTTSTTINNDQSEQDPQEDSAPQQSSIETAQTPNNQDHDDRNSRDEFAFENVLNTSIKMVHNFVSQLSSAIERDLSNLNLSIPRQLGDSPRETLNSQTQTENNQTPSNPEQQSSSEPMEHPGVICDNCHKRVRGMRWKCITCPNYDLCQVCKTNKPNVHSHEFRPIPYPINSSNNSRTGLRAVKNMHSATCDYCESVIIAFSSTQHPNHTFVPIHRPGDPDIKIPASPNNKHDPNHVFIKFKRPVPSPISSTRPLLQNFYSRPEPKNYQKENRQPKSQKPLNKENTTEPSPRKSSCFIPIVRPTTGVEQSIDPNFSSAPINLYGPPRTSTVSLNSLNSSSSSVTRVEEPQTPATNTINSTDVPLIPIKVQASPIITAPIPKEVSPPPVTTATTVSSIPKEVPSSQASTNSSILIETFPSEVKQKPIIEPALNARFVDDINIPDGTVLEPLTQFHKIWKMVNNGDINWPEDTILVHVGGPRMVKEGILGRKDIEFQVGPVAVGETINITADLQAPLEPGKHVSYWCLDDGNGNKFGHRVWCDITVEAEDSTTANMSASSMIFPVMNFDHKSVSAQSEKSTDIDDNSVISGQYDSDEESDAMSTTSSEDSAQDFIVVEKDSDDETDLRQSQHSLMGGRNVLKY
ncbi:5661_t:CDS:10 [Diversispora eburnea]|uniref:5661_t:CDS:1 n=1 Tax=Diversispora eburnea TaxID=1213867 RepID=A0A9N8V003_9GLOM|nr:5661_t:CDS:10 [Diversispora eburnea]